MSTKTKQTGFRVGDRVRLSAYKDYDCCTLGDLQLGDVGIVRAVDEEAGVILIGVEWAGVNVCDGGSRLFVEPENLTKYDGEHRYTPAQVREKVLGVIETKGFGPERRALEDLLDRVEGGA